MQEYYAKTNKTFLTPAPHEDSSVSWSVSAGAFHNGRQDSIEGTLKIRDCYKTISIELYVGTEKELDQKIAKLDTLIGELCQMQFALKEAWDYRHKSSMILPNPEKKNGR